MPPRVARLDQSIGSRSSDSCWPGVSGGAGRRFLDGGERLLGGVDQRAQGGEVALAVRGEGIPRLFQGGVESLANLAEGIRPCLVGGCWRGGSPGQHAVEIRVQDADAPRPDADGTK